jgi:ATP-dependent protease ClpP protease subunit
MNIQSAGCINFKANSSQAPKEQPKMTRAENIVSSIATGGMVFGLGIGADVLITKLFKEEWKGARRKFSLKINSAIGAAFAIYNFIKFSKNEK